MGNESTETSKGAETSTQNNNLKQPQNEENKNNKNKIINNNTIFVPTIQQDVDFKQILVPSLKSTHEQMRNCITINLLTACQREINFLRMIDRKAPVLYDRIVVANAIRRYECFWLPAQASKPDLLNIPPLDVHWVWHVHMLSPVSYREDCVAICGTVVDHKLLSADEIQQRYEQSVSAWNNFCPEEPYEFLSSSSKPYKQKSKYDIVEAVQRQRNFNYQISLPHYTSPRFLNDAIDRYINFLQLKQTYSDQFLTPCYDFDLVWHTHQVHPEDYFRNCVAIFGSLLKHDDSINDRNKGSKLLRGEAFTKKAWASHFKNNFWRRGCMFRGHNAPAFLCLESDDESSNNASNLAYGNIHIPSIVLKELPVQREQLRLKLRYGGKKISTFSAQLWDKQVTRPSFSLIWQPNPCGLKCIQNNKNVTKQANGHSKNSTGSASSTSTSSSTSSTSSQQQQQPSTSSSNYLSTIINSSSSSTQQIPSIVKFPFERKTAKEFVVELELFDKVFLHKRDLVKLKGRLPLDKLLPLQISSNINSKSSQNVVQLQLENVNGEHAKINITTSVSLNRELELQAGEYREQQLTTEDSRLWTLCQAAALNRAQLQPGAKIYVALHK
uniref:Uncharacterized protein n=1 Tax=Meloidogyne incognita TaxID=6306 RepID=A0A914KN17_MELIC